MDLSDFFDIPRPFADRSGIRAAAKVRGNKLGLLLIFDTPKQRTWLVSGTTGLSCVFDIVAEREPRELWFEARDSLVRGGQIILEIRSEGDDEDKFGLLHLGKHKPRKYSKRLFVDRTIESAIRNLIQSHF